MSEQNPLETKFSYLSSEVQTLAMVLANYMVQAQTLEDIADILDTFEPISGIDPNDITSNLTELEYGDVLIKQDKGWVMAEEWRVFLAGRRAKEEKL